MLRASAQGQGRTPVRHGGGGDPFGLFKMLCLFLYQSRPTLQRTPASPSLCFAPCLGVIGWRVPSSLRPHWSVLEGLGTCHAGPDRVQMKTCFGGFTCHTLLEKRDCARSSRRAHGWMTLMGFS